MLTMSEQTYDDISSIYQYYTPLRGFDETTTEDVHAYFAQGHGAGLQLCHILQMLPFAFFCSVSLPSVLLLLLREASRIALVG